MRQELHDDRDAETQHRAEPFVSNERLLDDETDEVMRVSWAAHPSLLAPLLELRYLAHQYRHGAILGCHRELRNDDVFLLRGSRLPA